MARKQVIVTAAKPQTSKDIEVAENIVNSAKVENEQLVKQNREIEKGIEKLEDEIERLRKKKKKHEEEGAENSCVANILREQALFAGRDLAVINNELDIARKVLEETRLETAKTVSSAAASVLQASIKSVELGNKVLSLETEIETKRQILTEVNTRLSFLSGKIVERQKEYNEFCTQATANEYQLREKTEKLKKDLETINERYIADTERINAAITAKNDEYNASVERLQININKFERRKEEVRGDVEEAEEKIRFSRKIGQEIDERAEDLAKNVERAKIDKYMASKISQ